MDLKTWIIVLAVTLFVFWNPMTRSLVLFILPLGSGVDDFIFLAAAVTLGVLLVVRYISKRRAQRPDKPTKVTWIGKKD